MDFLAEMPVWAVAALIFCLRIVDVSIGTMRTITVVQGWVKLSVVLAFFEVLIWISAVSQVIVGIGKSPVLLLAYAAGFATGNAVGILIEKKLALGTALAMMISPRAGDRIAAALRARGFRLTTVAGEGRDGPVSVIHCFCPRKDLPGMLETAGELDPDVFYAVEPVREWRGGFEGPFPHPTGWRAVFKKK
jgi:uncharacterized protein YebE (UPF0316 family)